MSNVSDILSIALNDKFHQASNPFNLAQDFTKTLYQLVRAANHVFEKSSDISLGSIKHLIMDVNEAGAHSPLRPEAHKSCVLLLNIHDTYESDLRRRLVSLPEPGLALRFQADGKVDCFTTKAVLSENAKKIPKAVRSEKFSAANQNGIQEFVASWLRANLDSCTMVAIQKAYLKQEQKDCEALWVWSPKQRDRLGALNLD